MDQVALASTGPLRADYDGSADVLYLHKGHPIPSTTESGDGGLLLRHSRDDGSPSGVTVLAYRRDWLAQRVPLASKIAAFLGVDAAAVEQVLTAIAMHESAQ